MAAGEDRRRRAVLSRVGRVRRRLNLQVWAEALVAPMWVAVTLLVVGRVFLPVRVELIALVAITIAAFATVVRARPRRISIEQAAVIADRQAGAGGLLLTRLETAVGAWELGLNQQIKAIRLPPIRLWASARWLVLAVLFAAAGTWVPRVKHTPPSLNVAAASRVDQVIDKVEALAQEEAVPDAIETELARLQAELETGAFDATDWEATDSLEKSLDERAAQTSTTLSNAEQAAESLGQALAEAQGQEGAEAKREALEKELMKLAQDSASPQSKGTAAGEKPANAEAVRDALAKRREALAKAFGQKPGNGSSPKTASGKKGAKGTKAGGGAPSDQPGDQPSDKPGSDGTGHASHQGKGVGTGHGDAPPAELVFGGEANIDPDRLRFEALPQGKGGDDPGALYGLRAADPHVATDVPRTSSQGITAPGARAASQREGPLLPRNRVVIDRYFQSK